MPSYFYDKKFINSQIATMFRAGGNFQNAARKVKSILFDINEKDPNPFRGIPVTNNGETRIENCVKYDLNGFARLITIQTNDVVVIVFFGKHDECDRWLNNNKGKKITYDPENKVIVDIFNTNDVAESSNIRNLDSDLTSKLLYKKLGEHYFNKISSLISGKLIIPFLEIDSLVEEDLLIEYCLQIDNKAYQSLFLDVFSALIEGNVDGAKNIINYHFDNLKPIDKIDVKELGEIVSNENYIKSDDLDPEILEFIVNKSTWQEFMLFLHPSQKEIVNKDFKGVARLLGVSGSGKTSVLVHRAIRLAQKYLGEKILIITLNPSLTILLENLINGLLDLKNKQELRNQIEVTSYWKFCRDKLLIFKKNEPLIKRKFESKGYKDGNIKEIWTEYYYYQEDDFDGSLLFPIHQSLLERGINPKTYIKEEFDWLRSALNKSERKNYLSIDRKGRAINFTQEFRNSILKSLEIWEHKMNHVGITDYMNLTTELNAYIDEINPEYRCVLVDEIQDFGTTELQVIKKLASDNENNFFFTGDLAQQVYAKHHKIRNAGFNILPEGYFQIRKNYRNSREILDAAYNMFSSNVNNEQIEFDDFKILKPEYANFSSIKPFLRYGESIEDEINSSIAYLKSLNDKDKKSCIAICGLGYFQIVNLGKELNLKVLDGTLEINSDSIFLSDLEQTKGFEFDRMIILNVTEGIFPNPSLPEAETYRDICKLYVSMTRAKKELIVSYSKRISNIFQSSNEYFTQDSWVEHKSNGINVSYTFNNVDFKKTRFSLKINGKDFILRLNDFKISKVLQEKLIEKVSGRTLTGAGEKQWKTVSDLFADLEKETKHIMIRHFFGPSTFNELLELKKRLSVKNKS